MEQNLCGSQVYCRTKFDALINALNIAVNLFCDYFIGGLDCWLHVISG